jgi:tRNA 2-thiouridine synthesizing protein E
LNDTIAAYPVKRNAEGYLTDPSEWTPDLAAELAREEGIALTPKHYEVLNFLRERYLSGQTLSMRRIGKSGVVTIKELYELFPVGPLKKASLIAGIPKPASCV